jgi:ATP-binding cassette subfamily F protein uup
MSLLRIDQLQLRIGEQVLLDNAQLAVEDGERIALVGRNGCGKSTLLGIIAGLRQADDGECVIRDGASIALLAQQPNAEDHPRCIDAFFDAFGDTGEWLRRHYDNAEDAQATEQLSRLEAWQLMPRIEQALQRLDMQADAPTARLSGGQQRRLQLAAQMATEPDLLLLDEPTNHLDMASIDALIDDLRRSKIALLLISHDRAFIDALAETIVELDRGHLSRWPAPYARYLDKRAEALNAEALEQQRLDKKLAEEERWVRQGIKARRTRNEGRVRALKALRREHAERRQRTGRVSGQIDTGNEGGRRVVDAVGLRVAPGERLLVDALDLRIMRGDKLAVVGPNGAGKTTLVRTLLGERPAEAGSVSLGTGLSVGYLDQHRDQLDPNQNALDNVAQGREFLDLDGKQVHVISYLQRFLFTPERARAPIHRLSGGEKNRLLLARVLAQQVNLLVLDEPTNDLDIDTLEVLEEMLVDYHGTLIVISHDRRFVENIATEVLVMDGEGHAQLHVGGLPERLPWQQRVSATKDTPEQPSEVNEMPGPEEKQIRASKPPRGKLSYKLQRELDQLPAQIEQLETQLSEMQDQLNDPSLFQTEPERGQTLAKALADCEQQLEQAFERWGELEEQRERLAAGDA